MSASSPTTMRGEYCVADLATTDETVGVLCIGETMLRKKMICRAIQRNRRDVEVGFNIAKAGPGVHANVPAGPVIDRRGRRRRSLDGYISRKCRCCDQRGNRSHAGRDFVHGQVPRKTGDIIVGSPSFRCDRQATVTVFTQIGLWRYRAATQQSRREDHGMNRRLCLRRPKRCSGFPNNQHRRGCRTGGVGHSFVPFALPSGRGTPVPMRQYTPAQPEMGNGTAASSAAA